MQVPRTINSQIMALPKGFPPLSELAQLEFIIIKQDGQPAIYL